MVIGALLRQVVAMVDAIEILLCKSAIHAATLQLRALFEASIYIDWILAADGENKSAYYYVHNLLRRRLWAMRVQTGTPESMSFSEVMKKDGLPLDNTLANEGKRLVKEIDRVLLQPRFLTVRTALQEWKKQNSRKPAWYSPFGVKNLREMAAIVNKEPIYVIVYDSGSQVMHASDYGSHVRLQKERITFLSIRHPKEFPNTVRFTAMIALDTFMKILGAYRKGELPRFSQKYVEVAAGFSEYSRVEDR